MKIQTQFRLADGVTRTVYVTDSGYQLAEVDTLDGEDHTRVSVKFTMESNRAVNFGHAFKYVTDWRLADILSDAEEKANKKLRWPLLKKKVKRVLTFFTRRR